MCLNCADIIIQRQLDEEGINDVVAKMVRDYDKTLTGAWVRESDEAIEKSSAALLDASSNETGYTARIAVLTKRLKKVVTPDEVKRLTVLTDGLYRVVKEAEATKIDAAFKMTKLDKGVVRALAKDSGNASIDSLDRFCKAGASAPMTGRY